MDSSKLEELASISKNVKVLCVDDDAGARHGIEMLLKNFFPNVQTAIDGQDGLIKFKSSKFDLILTDITMPNMGGVDMIKSIREISSDVSVIIISAACQPDTLKEIEKICVSANLLKPIDMPILIETLLEVVHQINQKKACE